MNRHFFLNYGGPGDLWYSENLKTTEDLDKICQHQYKIPIRNIKFTIKDLEIRVTFYIYGPHRALRVEVPQNASDDSIQAFEKAKQAALILACQTEYALLSNNCVTAVAKVLNTLDPIITTKDRLWPWSLDKSVKKYSKYHPVNSVIGCFTAKYTEMSHHQFFPCISTRHWEKKTIHSTNDIIIHAYSEVEDTARHVKSTLKKLRWVKEDENNILRPTDKAPHEFKIELEKFNDNYEKKLHLKNPYKTKTGCILKVKGFFECSSHRSLANPNPSLNGPVASQ